MTLFRAFDHRNYRLFFGGQFVSLVGTWMQTIALSWLVYRLTGSAALLGAVMFAIQAPVFIVSPLSVRTARSVAGTAAAICAANNSFLLSNRSAASPPSGETMNTGA